MTRMTMWERADDMLGLGSFLAQSSLLAMQCYAMLRYAMLCYAMLCYSLCSVNTPNACDFRCINQKVVFHGVESWHSSRRRYTRSMAIIWWQLRRKRKRKGEEEVVSKRWRPGRCGGGLKDAVAARKSFG